MTDPKDKNSNRRSSRRTAASKPKQEEAEHGDKGQEENQEPEQQEEQAPSCPSYDPEENGEGVWDRILWVRSNLPLSIQKDKFVKVNRQGDGYWVLTSEGINLFLLPLLNAAGLIDYVTLRKSKIRDTGLTNNSGRKTTHHHAKYEYIIQRADEPGQNVSIEVEGIGEDNADKGSGKASTYAQKDGRKTMFSIAAGDREEDRQLEDDPEAPRVRKAPLTPEHLDELLKLADELFGDESEVAIKHLSDSPAFKVTAIEELPDELFEAACNKLRNWKKSREQKPADGDDIPQGE